MNCIIDRKKVDADQDAQARCIYDYKDIVRNFELTVDTNNNV